MTNHTATTEESICIAAINNYDYDCPCCNFYEPSYALLFPWMVILIGVGIAYALTQVRSNVPYAAVMFLIGTSLGVIATIQSTGCCNAFIISTLMWTQIDSNVLLLTILPGLILRDAVEVNFDVFMLALGQLLMLAYPMVLIGTVLTGCAAYYLLPWDWPWSLTLTLGAILGSTDPIAVASVLKRLGAPPRLQLHLAGESTLNDGSAMVFFNVFSRVWFSSLPDTDVEEVELGEGFALFFQNSLGGFAVGLAFAICLLFTLHELDKRMEPDYDILQAGLAVAASYLSYYVADQLLQMSGVTASVTVGILAKAFGRGLMKDAQGMIKYLSLMEFLLNTLLFALGGVIWGALLVRNIQDEDLDFSGTIEWFWLILMYLLVMAIRFVQVAAIYPIWRRMGLKSDWKEAVFLAFAGMRGAVGIALALSLYRQANQNVAVGPENQRLVNSIFFLSGGISLCTLLINGTTAPWVLRFLGLVVPSDRKRVVRLFEVSAEQYMAKKFQHYMSLPRYQGASFMAIKSHVPFITDECKKFLEGGPRSSPLPIDSEVEDIMSINGPVPPKRGHSRSATDDGQINMYLKEFSQRLVDLSSRRSPTSNEGGGGPGQEAMVSEIRHMYLDVVYHTYVRKLQDGEIDDDGNLVNNPEYMRHNLGDYFLPTPETATDIGNTVPVREYWWNRLEMSIADIFRGQRKKAKTAHAEQGPRELQQYRKNRPVVQRTIAFIGAHRSAESGFRRYIDDLLETKRKKQEEGTLGSADAEAAAGGETQQEVSGPQFDALKEAVETVLEESHKQVQTARERLDTLPEQTVRRVQSHMLASILLKRLTRFLAKNVEDQTLDPKEAQKYMDLIATKSEELKSCTGEEVLLDVPTGGEKKQGGIVKKKR